MKKVPVSGFFLLVGVLAASDAQWWMVVAVIATLAIATTVLVKVFARLNPRARRDVTLLVATLTSKRRDSGDDPPAA